jgi:uncharacterized protein YjbI with pentapeptide repeats
MYRLISSDGNRESERALPARSRLPDHPEAKQRPSRLFESVLFTKGNTICPAYLSEEAMNENQTHTDKRFEDQDYSQQHISLNHYELCHFIHCDFSDCRIEDCRFVDCRFQNTNLSLARFDRSRFLDCEFYGCKLTGIDWTLLDWNSILLTSPIYLDECDISFSNFYELKISELVATRCKAHDVNFEGCDLSKADFSGTELTDSQFRSTNLKNSKFNAASQYFINPLENDIEGASFSFPDVLSLLSPFKINIED